MLYRYVVGSRPMLYRYAVASMTYRLCAFVRGAAFIHERVSVERSPAITVHGASRAFVRRDPNNLLV